MLTPGQIFDKVKDLESERAQMEEINRLYRAQDESMLWPICGKFDATERAIRRALKEARNAYLNPMEYCFLIDEHLSEIVNNPKNC